MLLDCDYWVYHRTKGSPMVFNFNFVLNSKLEERALKREVRRSFSALGVLLQVRQLERTVSLRDLSIVEIDEKMRELSAATYDGVFVWKISDFTKKRQDAVAGRAPATFSPGNTFPMRKHVFGSQIQVSASRNKEDEWS